MVESETVEPKDQKKTVLCPAGICQVRVPVIRCQTLGQSLSEQLLPRHLDWVTLSCGLLTRQSHSRSVLPLL
jgi:hypothetical protein